MFLQDKLPNANSLAELGAIQRQMKDNAMGFVDTTRRQRERSAKIELKIKKLNQYDPQN